MKIAKYIELVKKAENSNNEVYRSLSGSIEGLPAEQQQVIEFGLNALREQAKQNGERLSHFTTPTRAGETPSSPVEIDPQKVSAEIETRSPKFKRPVLDRGWNGGAPPRLRQPFTLEDYGIHFGRLDGTRGFLSNIHPALEGIYVEPPFKLQKLKYPWKNRTVGQYLGDWLRPQAYKDWARFRWNNAGKSSLNFLKSIPNAPFDTVNAVTSSPVRWADTSGMGAAFSFALPMDQARNDIETRTYDKMIRAGINPAENKTTPLPFPLNYEYNFDPAVASYYYPELGTEVVKQTPNMLSEYASFSTPMFPVSIGTDLLINMPYQFFSGDDKPLLMGGLRHPDYRANRLRTDEDYEAETAELSNLGELLPDILKTNDDRYQRGNLAADITGNYFDPMLQWPFGLLYGHNMSQIAKLMNRPNAVSFDEWGRATVDYRDLLSPIFGSKGAYEQDGGRPELRYLTDEKKRQHINDLKEAAAEMGYTRGEIERAIQLYDNPNSLLYKGANLLKLMGMPAKDIYTSIYMGDIAKEPRSIHQYITIPSNSIIGGVSDTKKENPEWQRAKDALTRQLADQETLFKINPFFAALKNSENQLSKEENEFLSNPDNIKTLDDLPIDNVMRPVFEEDFPDTDSYRAITEAKDSAVFGLLPYVARGWNPKSSKNVNNPARLLNWVGRMQKELPEAEVQKELPEAEDTVYPLGAPEDWRIERWNTADREREEFRVNYQTNYFLNRVARLPYQYRYAALRANPEYIKPFLDKYYTNEETKQRIFKFLVPEAEAAATQMALIAPILQKVRQSVETAQRRNAGM